MPSKLLDGDHGERLDEGTQGETVDCDHTLVSVEASTGPRSAEGKARVSRNAYRGALRAQWRQLCKVLAVAFREQQWDLLLPAIDRLEQLMRQNASPSTALAAVCRILDLNGHVPDHERTHKGRVVVQEELPKASPELVSYLNSILASVPDWRNFDRMGASGVRVPGRAVR